MKSILSGVLFLAATATLMQASTIESISIDLSTLHAGSTLSGTFTLPTNATAGTTVPVLLSFSDPADYTPTSISATINIGNGTTLAYTVGFSTISFTNPSGNQFTINNNLNVFGAAQCASFPCTATGRFEDNSPAAFTATYSIAPVVTAAPEPATTSLLALLTAGFFLTRRLPTEPRA